MRLSDGIALGIQSEYVINLRSHGQVGSPLVWLLKVPQKVGSPDLDFVHYGFKVGLHVGAADAEHVGHGQNPLLLKLSAQRQPRPGDASLQLSHRSDTHDQRFMGASAGPIVGVRLQESFQAGRRQSQCLVAMPIHARLNQSSYLKVHFHHIPARPIGATVDLSQPRQMAKGDGGFVHLKPVRNGALAHGRCPPTHQTPWQAASTAGGWRCLVRAGTECRSRAWPR